MPFRSVFGSSRTSPGHEAIYPEDCSARFHFTPGGPLDWPGLTSISKDGMSGTVHDPNTILSWGII